MSFVESKKGGPQGYASVSLHDLQTYLKHIFGGADKDDFVGIDVGCETAIEVAQDCVRLLGVLAGDACWKRYRGI